MTVTLSLEDIVNFGKLITSLTIIIGVIISVVKQFNKWTNYDKRIDKVTVQINKLKTEQCLQTYVLQAVLDGLHQLGCNGKTTEASERLNTFLNNQAHEEFENEDKGEKK